MDERDAEALGRGLASGLADAFADALDRTVGTSGISEREQAAEKKERAAIFQAMREIALADCRRKWTAGRECCADMAECAVDAYCASARAAISEKGKGDPRLPDAINYGQRYRALRKVGSRDVLLGRLEQTLDLADAILAGTARIDVGTYFSEAAASYREQILKLESVAVAEPAHDEAEEHAKQQEQGIADLLRCGDEAASAAYEDALAALDDQLEKAFADEISALDASGEMGADAGAYAGVGAPAADGGAGTEIDFVNEVEALSGRLDEIVQRMNERYEASCEANAALVATSRLSLGDLPSFTGTVSCEFRYDVAEVAAFAAEVRRSFSTYKQVVEDNGVFAAFPDGSDFKNCGDAGGPHAASGIPTTIEEDDVEGGDSPARATEKLRQLNAKRYFGLLDEDFDVHVKAFWYGYRKLMEFTNELFKVSPREFGDYCYALRVSAAKRARALGVLMSYEQAVNFAEQVKKLSEEVSSRSS